MKINLRLCVCVGVPVREREREILISINCSANAKNDLLPLDIHPYTYKRIPSGSTNESPLPSTDISFVLPFFSVSQSVFGRCGGDISLVFFAGIEDQQKNSSRMSLWQPTRGLSRAWSSITKNGGTGEEEEQIGEQRRAVRGTDVTDCIDFKL